MEQLGADEWEHDPAKALVAASSVEDHLFPLVSVKFCCGAVSYSFRAKAYPSRLKHGLTCFIYLISVRCVVFPLLCACTQ
ncbi:hypothetical protein RIF29_19750 [Crotalaria pallida]|uniref:Uncharacterized protein n=1 Tax=Crotalaria pallida TaxID=3830 RepID=A0AAN9IBQ0_CROPI